MSLLHRRHSRASSVDRREIFNKYIQRSGEHSDSVRPYSSDDPELICSQQSNLGLYRTSRPVRIQSGPAGSVWQIWVSSPVRLGNSYAQSG